MSLGAGSLVAVTKFNQVIDKATFKFKLWYNRDI